MCLIAVKHLNIIGVLHKVLVFYLAFQISREKMRRTRSRGMRGGPGRMPPFMRGPPGQKFVVSHSTFDPAMVGCMFINVLE